MYNLRDYGYQVIHIEVTNRCNMACTFCPLPKRKKPLRDMTRNEAFGIIRELSQFEGIDYVAFHQFGEPLLYKYLWDCIERCRLVGLKTNLTTNGLLLNQENINKILSIPPDYLWLSLQTPDPAVYRKTRGVKVSFDHYIDQMANCVATLFDKGNCETIIDIAVNPSWKASLKHSVRRMLGIINTGDPTLFNAEPKLLRRHMIHFLELVEDKSESFKFSIDHLDECIRDYYSNGKRRKPAYQLKPDMKILYKDFVNGYRLTNQFPVEKGICGTKILGILADGTVVCCCVDYDGFTGIGNVFEEPLYNILVRSKSIFDGLRKTGELPFEVCRRCRGATTRLGAIMKQYRFNKIFKKPIFNAKER